MNIPFSVDQFMRVFQIYNDSIWPMQIVLYIFAAVAIMLLFMKTKYSNKIISGILGFLWLWTGAVYHILHFSAINKAAYVFGGVIIIQSILFFIFGVIKNKLMYEATSWLKNIIGSLFIAYGLIAYPIIGFILGHKYPFAPTFGAPCPTTIFTFGILMFLSNNIQSKIIVLIPFLWSVIGFTAALKLSVKEDIGLLVAGIIATIWLLFMNKNGK